MLLDIEYIGYLAVILNLLSFTQKGELNIRIWSIIANLTFLIYGLNKNTKALIIGTILTILIHVFKIFNILKDSKKI
jgi:hypothetical protein